VFNEDGSVAFLNVSKIKDDEVCDAGMVSASAVALAWDVEAVRDGVLDHFHAAMEKMLEGHGENEHGQ
jgi:hypothetical protein